MPIEYNLAAIQNRKSKIQNRSGGFDYFAGLQAAGADSNTFGSSTDDRADRLQVGIEAAVGPVVGVTHPVTKLRSLAADFTTLGHYYVPPMRI